MKVTLVLTVSAPEGLEWLTGAERQFFSRLRIAPRQESWLLGRWAAKHAISSVTGKPAELIEVIGAPDGAPESAGVSVSIAHRAGLALAVATPGSHRIGCDIEFVEPRSDAFIEDFFLPAEIDAVRASADPAVTANLIWCGKEVALKISRTGLRRDTRSVLVDPGSASWGITTPRDATGSEMPRPSSVLVGKEAAQSAKRNGLRRMGPMSIYDLETPRDLVSISFRTPSHVLVIGAEDPFELGFASG